jgi:hypothetical protein
VAKQEYQTPFVLDRGRSRLFVEVARSGIDRLTLDIDRIPLHFFGADQTAYLAAEDAIAWHEKELRESGGKSGGVSSLGVLREALKQFRAGTLPPRASEPWRRAPTSH